ncbi:hypothetical protein AB4144_64200, partial [Rhizobiaceae sp. 2RAB30]
VGRLLLTLLVTDISILEIGKVCSDCGVIFPGLTAICPALTVGITEDLIAVLVIDFTAMGCCGVAVIRFLKSAIQALVGTSISMEAV